MVLVAQVSLVCQHSYFQWDLDHLDHQVILENLQSKAFKLSAVKQRLMNTIYCNTNKKEIYLEAHILQRHHLLVLLLGLGFHQDQHPQVLLVARELLIITRKKVVISHHHNILKQPTLRTIISMWKN